MPVLPSNVDIPEDVDFINRGLFEERVSILLSTVMAMDCVFPVKALNECAARHQMNPGDRDTIFVCREEVKGLVACMQKSEEDNPFFLRLIQAAGRKACTQQLNAFAECYEQNGRTSTLLTSCKQEHRAYMECGAQIIMNRLLALNQENLALQKQ